MAFRFFKNIPTLLASVGLATSFELATNLETYATGPGTVTCSAANYVNDSLNSLQILVVEGEVISVTWNAPHTTPPPYTGAGAGPSGSLSPGLNTFVVGAGEGGTWAFGDRSYSGSLSITCAVGGATSPTSVNAGGSTAMAGAAARVFSEGVHTTVVNRFAGGDAFSGAFGNGSGSAYASTSRIKAPDVLMAYGDDGNAASLSAPQNAWHMWGRVDVSGFGDAGKTDMDGWSVQGAGGVDYRLSDSVIIGLLFGYESADLDFDTAGSSFEGHGPSIGVYAGYKVTDNIIIDATVAHSWLDYDTTVGTATGSFDATRILVAANVAGKYQVTSKISVEPGIRVVFAHENQDGFTMSDATVVGKNTVSSGSISSGPTIYYDLSDNLSAGSKIWLSLKSNYDFSSEDITNTSLPDFDGVHSGRVGVGFQTTVSDAAKLSVSGEVGGLGSNEYTSYTGRVKVVIPLGGR